MKKILFATMALGMTMTSCMNDEFPNAARYGYINLNVSNDPVMQTRGVTDVPVNELSKWTITAEGENTYTFENTNSCKVKQGTYTVSAQNYTTEKSIYDIANKVNEGWGDAFYQGSTTNVEVNPGETEEVSIACGTAQNARIKVVFNLVDNFTDYSLTVDPNNRNLTFNSANTNYTNIQTCKYAYFAANATVSYNLSWKYGNGDQQNITGKSITLGGKATENVITVSSNDNGTITVTVTYDDTFQTGTEQEITFDAATGTEVTTN